jgi:hypothetical protein
MVANIAKNVTPNRTAWGRERSGFFIVKKIYSLKVKELLSKSMYSKY